jgi:hypothetical protein
MQSLHCCSCQGRSPLPPIICKAISIYLGICRKARKKEGNLIIYDAKLQKTAERQYSQVHVKNLFHNMVITSDFAINIQ